MPVSSAAAGFVIQDTDTSPEIVHGAGDYSCFQPTAPCGSPPPGAPTATLLGGQGWPVFFQQNLNHYNPSFPGYLDLSLSTVANPTSQDNFTLLARIPDFWAHLQAKQTNVSMPVLVPNIDCPACVLQVRYVPHKQTEPIFHNCADIVITQQPAPTASGSVFAFAVSGNKAAPFYASAGSELMSVQPSGLALPVASTMALAPPVAVSEGSITSAGPGTVLALARQTSAMGGPGPSADDGMASTLVVLNTTSATPAWTAVAISTTPTDLPIQWDGITTAQGWSQQAQAGDKKRGHVRGRAAGVSSAASSTTAFLVGRDSYPNGTFRFQARTVDITTGALSPILAVSQPDGGQNPDPMVNFMAVTQAYVDPTAPSTATFYLLSGDENSLFALNAAVYTATITAGAQGVAAITETLLDVSAWTINSLTLDPATGILYTVSPGLYGSTNGYFLVTVDPATGKVSAVGSQPIFSPASLVDMDPTVAYKGAVYGNAIRSDGCLLHTFRRSLGGAPMLACVDLKTGLLKDAPTLLTGANNDMELASMVRVD